ncbi:MAG: hypothetical protein Q4E76_07065 [Tissierellia bacterium]|nr:hypothetical protein [Tissierellia bacterium]
MEKEGHFWGFPGKNTEKYINFQKKSEEDPPFITFLMESMKGKNCISYKVKTMVKGARFFTIKPQAGPRGLLTAKGFIF